MAKKEFMSINKTLDLILRSAMILEDGLLLFVPDVLHQLSTPTTLESGQS